MALQLGALRAALISAGSDPQKADEAATEAAGYENRLGAIETRLTVLAWMVATAIAMVAVVGGPALWLLLRVAAKIGALT
jgi:hypothetical protein